MKTERKRDEGELHYFPQYRSDYAWIDGKWEWAGGNTQAPKTLDESGRELVTTV